jgi:hypothetical protein
MNRGVFPALRIVSGYTACFMSDITRILVMGGAGFVSPTVRIEDGIPLPRRWVRA